MPYPKDHKTRSRARIVEAARELFNTHGFDRVSIDMVQKVAALGAPMLAAVCLVPATAGGFGIELPSWMGLVVALGTAGLIGYFNGFMVVRTAVPSLIVTLGSLFAVQGVVLGLTVLITKSTSVALKVEGPAKAIFGDFVFGGRTIWPRAIWALHPDTHAPSTPLAAQMKRP